MSNTYAACVSLESVPKIPNGVTEMDRTFRYCTSLKTAPNIPTSVDNMYSTFYGCSSLYGTIKIDATLTSYSNCFYETEKEIFLTGSSTLLAELAATDGYTDLSVNDNVRVS